MNRLHAPYPWGATMPTLAQDALRGKPKPTGRLQDNTLVACAPGNALAVEILQQGNRIFAGDSGEFLENRHGDSLALLLLVGDQAVAELAEGVTMEDQLRGDADQDFVA